MDEVAKEYEQDIGRDTGFKRYKIDMNNYWVCKTQLMIFYIYDICK